MHFILNRIWNVSNPLVFKRLPHFAVSPFTKSLTAQFVPARSFLAPAPFQYEKKLLKKDNLSSDYQLIYRLHKSNFYVFCTLAGQVAICITLMLVYKKLTKDYLMDEKKSEQLMHDISVSIVSLTDHELIITSTVALLMGVFFYVFAKRFPLRIYYNGEKYVAVFVNSFLPLLKKNYTFTSGRKTRNYFTIFGGTTFKLGRRRARLYGEFFRRPVDLYDMMEGYVEDSEACST